LKKIKAKRLQNSELSLVLMPAKLINMNQLRVSSNISINLFYQSRLALSMENKKDFKVFSSHSIQSLITFLKKQEIAS
jgi:hypothetical protein